MGYQKQAFKGFSWIGALRLVIRAFGFIKIAILARILLPVQFGVYGIATLVLAFLETFTETGINVFLIQQKKSIDKYINTAWIVSIFRGAFISLSIFITAPFIAQFFEIKEAASIIKLISLVPLIRGFINPSIIKFQRELQFNKEFYFRAFIITIEALISIVLAIITKSAISLVIALIAAAILEVIISFVFLSPRPKFIFNKNHFNLIIKSGKWVTFAGIFNYLFHQGDDIVVGKLLSPAFLGLYQQAYKISTLPISEVADSFGKVTFPIYTKIGGDKFRLKKAFTKVSWSITLLTIPFGLILFIFPEQVVRLVLGENWLEAAPALRYLSVFGVVRAISGSASALFLAVKKQSVVTQITLVSLIGMSVTIFYFVNQWGIVGAGLSALTGSILALPVIIYHLKKELKTT